MAFTIPDKGEGANDVQSILFQEYFDILVAGISGSTCVKTGCAVSAQATPDMTVAVAAGTVRSNDVDFTVAAGNGTITAADAANPRLDLVVITSAGAIAVRAGTPAINPKPAARTSGDVALAVVYVPAADTTIESNQITDLRVVNNNITPGISGPFAHRNKIINGNFDIWQRGTSQTASGYGSVDRWSSTNGGTTKTHSRQTFTLGQTDVPGEPMYFSRTVVTSAAGTGNYCALGQFVESVRTLAGKNATITFWAKADAPKNIAIELYQGFGSGGTPSADVTAIGSQLIALTTTWQKFTRTIAVPSITGKTLGTNNDDWLGLYFWFDAGTDYNSRTSSLGQQSGTFDIAQVQVEEGAVATPFEQRPFGYEMQLCQRYYEKSYRPNTYPGAVSPDGGSGMIQWQTRVAIPASTAGTLRGTWSFAVMKRTIPSMVLYAYDGTANAIRNTNTGVRSGAIVPGISLTTYSSISIDATSATPINLDDIIDFHFTANAELM